MFRNLSKIRTVLSAGFLLAAVFGFGEAKAETEYLNNAQLTLLFSGNNLFSDGGVCGAGASLGSSTWDFDLNKDGSLEIIFACHKSVPFERRSSGNWRIDTDKLCMEDKDGPISKYYSNDKCWAVKPGAGFFEVYNSNSEKIWEFVVYSHKPNLPDGFGKQLAELKKLDGAQVAGKQSEPKVDEGTVRRQAAELNRRLAALEKREREDAARRQAAEMERKKETEKKRSLAAKETVYKKPPGASSALKERLAALKNLKETGLLSEEQFQAKTNAVLNEFLGLKGSSTTASKGAPGKKALSRKYADVNFGNYHALVIGANDYKYLPNLKTAINDAKVVAEILRDNYGFKVKLILNPTRGDILNALDDFREKLGSEDNLLIYYAGHGYLDEEAGRGYWLPVDAKPNRRYGWVSNGTLTDTLKTLQAKHVMIVADSCYSGTLTRGVKVGVRSGDYYKRMAKKWTRVALVSGGLEPVADSAGGGHSPFAKAFINALKGNVDVIDGTQLFSELRRPVTVSTQQTPEYSDVRNAGHDGGDFLFVRTK